MVLSNISNLIQDLDRTNVEVALIANGRGVMAFKKGSAFSGRVSQLKTLGVKFRICRNSLGMWKLDEDEMMDEIEFVNSGIGEIVRKQQECWAYIRP